MLSIEFGVMKIISTKQFKIAYDQSLVGKPESLPSPPAMQGHLAHLLLNYYHVHYDGQLGPEHFPDGIPGKHYTDFHGGNQSGAIELKQNFHNTNKLLDFFNNGEAEDAPHISWQDWYGIAGKLSDHLPPQKIGQKVAEIFQKYKGQLNGNRKHDIMLLSHGAPVKELTAWVHSQLVALTSHEGSLPG